MRAGTRSRRRAPARLLYQPSKTFFWGGILLCVTFGLTLAGGTEAYLTGDWVWFWIFVALAVVNLGLYLANVRWWLAWMG